MNRNIVRRTTLVVQDLERSLAFYRDVLGLTVWYDQPVTFAGVGVPGTQRGDRARLAILQCADPVIGMIGLLEFTEPRVPARPAPKQRLAVGDLIFVIQGEDVQGVYERLLASGARVHAPPHEDVVTGVDGRPLRLTTVTFWDPDDNFIEYNQRHD